MEILKDFGIIDLALFIKPEKTLVIADTQLGYEETLNKQGVFIPRSQYSELDARLKKILALAKPSLIIIDGDIKHEFGTISETEWRNTLRLIDFLASQAKLLLIRGNHDTILGPIAGKKNIVVSDYYFAND